MGRGKGLCITVIVVVVVGVILTIALVVPSYQTVETNQVGLNWDSTAKKLDETQVYNSGRYFIGVSHSFIIFHTDLQTLNFSSVPCRTQDGLALNISVSFQYKLLSTLDDLMKLVYLFPHGSQENSYVLMCRNVFRDTTARYEVFQFVYNRTGSSRSMIVDIESDLRTSTQSALGEYGASIENFQLVDITYPIAFQDAISQTQNAIQQIQTAQFSQTKATQTVKGRIAKATTKQQVILNTATIRSNNIIASANGNASSIVQRISALQVSLKSFQHNANITNITNLINYQWINAINKLQLKQKHKVPIRLDLPKQISCLYDRTSC